MKEIMKKMCICNLIAVLMMMSILPTLGLLKTVTYAGGETILKKPDGATVITRNISDYIISTFHLANKVTEVKEAGAKYDGADEQFNILDGTTLYFTRDDSSWITFDVALKKKDGTIVRKWECCCEPAYIHSEGVFVKDVEHTRTWKLNLTQKKMIDLGIKADEVEDHYWNIDIYIMKGGRKFNKKKLDSINFINITNTMKLVTNSDGSSCKYKNGTLYISPNSKVRFVSNWEDLYGLTGNYSSTGAIKTTHAATGSFQTTGKVGDTGTITWTCTEDENVSITTPVVISNF